MNFKTIIFTLLTCLAFNVHAEKPNILLIEFEDNRNESLFLFEGSSAQEIIAAVNKPHYLSTFYQRKCLTIHPGGRFGRAACDKRSKEVYSVNLSHDFLECVTLEGKSKCTLFPVEGVTLSENVYSVQMPQQDSEALAFNLFKSMPLSATRAYFMKSDEHGISGVCNKKITPIEISFSCGIDIKTDSKYFSNIIAEEYVGPSRNIAGLRSPEQYKIVIPQRDGGRVFNPNLPIPKYGISKYRHK